MNILFVINAGLAVFLSIGAAYFTIIPMILWGVGVERMVSGATQNYAMIGLWMIYFVNFAFLPIILKKNYGFWRIGYVVFLIGIVVFVVIIVM